MSATYLLLGDLMASKIRDLENKYPAFTILTNLLYYNTKDSSEFKMADLVKSVFDHNISKTDEQIVRNIILSLSENKATLNYSKKKEFELLTSAVNVKDARVKKSQLVDYIYELVGEYFMIDLNEFYGKIKANRSETVKKLIDLYLDYISSTPGDINEMTLSDAVEDLEQTIYFASKNESLMREITDLEVKKLIYDWSKEIGDSIFSDFTKTKPFVEIKNDE